MNDVNTYAKRAQELSPSTQYAIITVLKNITNGACWGFTSLEDVRQHADALKQDPNIKARKLGNACLIEVNPDYLISSVRQVDPNLVTQRDLDDMRKGLAEAAFDFEKFLINKGDKDEKSYLVGIYCINDSTAITYNGTPYPAFRINVNSFLSICDKWGYGVCVGKEVVSPRALMTNLKPLFESLILSPTNTGIFARIVPPADKVTFAQRKKEHKERLKASK